MRPDLDTARIAAALRSPAIVQVAWENRVRHVRAAHILAILETLQIVDIALGANRDADHRLQCLDRILAGSRLTGKHAGKPPDASADVFPLCRVGKALGAAEHRQFTLAIRTVMDGMLPAAGRILQRPAEHAAASEQDGIIRLKQLRVLRPERRFGTQAVIFVAAVPKINIICRHIFNYQERSL